jgi:hypothetical protein
VPKVSEDHLAARRRQILDGARRCFAEYGYDKATVRRLEQAIGMSRGAIFHHFRDKDALFFELAHRGCRADGRGREPRGSHPGDARHARRARPVRLAGHQAGDRAQASQRPRIQPRMGGALRGTGRPRRPSGCAARRRRTGYATTFPATCCSATWNWFSTGWWPGWHPAKIRSGCPLSSTWSRSRCAARLVRAHLIARSSA